MGFFIKRYTVIFKTVYPFFKNGIRFFLAYARIEVYIYIIYSLSVV